MHSSARQTEVTQQSWTHSCLSSSQVKFQHFCEFVSPIIRYLVGTKSVAREEQIRNRWSDQCEGKQPIKSTVLKRNKAMNENLQFKRYHCACKANPLVHFKAIRQSSQVFHTGAPLRAPLINRITCLFTPAALAVGSTLLKDLAARGEGEGGGGEGRGGGGEGGGGCEPLDSRHQPHLGRGEDKEAASSSNCKLLSSSPDLCTTSDSVYSPASLPPSLTLRIYLLPRNWAALAALSHFYSARAWADYFPTELISALLRRNPSLMLHIASGRAPTFPKLSVSFVLCSFLIQSVALCNSSATYFLYESAQLRLRLRQFYIIAKFT